MPSTIRRSGAGDAGLRGLFQKHMLGIHWQPIETSIVAAGVPDLNGCGDGLEIWIEMKATHGWTINKTLVPAQVAWAERRARAGGRVFLAVRQLGAGRDDLWMFGPAAFRPLIDGARLHSVPAFLGTWTGGPQLWAWDRVWSVLSTGSAGPK